MRLPELRDWRNLSEEKEKKCVWGGGKRNGVGEGGEGGEEGGRQAVNQLFVQIPFCTNSSSQIASLLPLVGQVTGH